MKINNVLLKNLMNEVDERVDKLLARAVNQSNEINQLKHQNEQLKKNYSKILDQIAGYIEELEEIKKLTHNK